MSNIKKHIPNTITLLNLLAGTISIYLSTQGMLFEASLFIIIAAVLDFLDGFTARLLSAYSELGKQLDSLSDLVSFGIAPAFILSAMAKHNIQGNSLYQPGVLEHLIILAPMVLVLGAALRLAKFNIDYSQANEFKGLPAPASGLLIAGIPFMIHFESFELITRVLTQSYTLIILAIVLSILMICRLPMFSLKFKNFKWHKNALRYVFLICCLCFFLFKPASGIFLSILLYILIALGRSVFIRT